MVLCLLAADEEEAEDAALQIHFTLIQAFCCENDINILRVSNPARLAQLLLPHTATEPPTDLHCVLVTVRMKQSLDPRDLPAVPTRISGLIPRADPSSRCRTPTRPSGRTRR